MIFEAALQHLSSDLVTGDSKPTRRTLGNLDIAIRAAGGTRADVAQVQVFLVEETDTTAMNRVYAEFFKEPYPVRATVVKELLAEACAAKFSPTPCLATLAEPASKIHVRESQNRRLLLEGFSERHG